MVVRKKQSLASKVAQNDLAAQFKSGLVGSKPWESIVDFTTHKSFCGYKPYPRQLTLLKLIYLETEHMTQFDYDVINEWRQGFGSNLQSIGVQSDIWERVDWLKANGYRRFPHVQAVLGRRASKGWTGGILGAESLAHFVSLDNWQQALGIQEHRVADLQVIATTLPQAMKNQFADIVNAVTSCKYLDPYKLKVENHEIFIQTPADLRYQSMRRRMGEDIRDIYTLRASAQTSSSASGRGATAFSIFYDEFAHLIVGTSGPRSSEELYNAYQPSLAQFDKDQFAYVPSSPLTKVGKFFSLYATGSVPGYFDEKTNRWIQKDLYAKDINDEDPQESFEKATSNPRMLIIQLPSWGLYQDWEKSPSLGGFNFKRAVMEYDDALMTLEAANPEEFKVEYRGQFAEVQDAYLDPVRVDRIFDPFWPSEENQNKGRVLQKAEFGRMDNVYHAHIDPALSGANFALTIAHLENAPPDKNGDVYPHVIIDELKVWKPSDFAKGDGTRPEIDYEVVTTYLEEVLDRYPSMEMMTSDQWNSASFLQRLQKKKHSARVKVESFTPQSNKIRAETFKSVMNLGWIHAYKDNYFSDQLGGTDGQSLLEQELKFLTEKNGKIEKQELGPVTTKDLADTVMEVSTRLLTRALNRWRSQVMGETRLSASGAQTTRVVDGSPYGPPPEFNPFGGGGSSPSELRRGNAKDLLSASGRTLPGGGAGGYKSSRGGRFR